MVTMVEEVIIKETPVCLGDSDSDAACELLSNTHDRVSDNE